MLPSSSQTRKFTPTGENRWCKSIRRRQLYKAWENMRARCRAGYEYHHCYADRGIVVCNRWDHFANFVIDMGPHPGKGWSLDRKNNDKGYYKRNCRWVTPPIQAQNRRTTKLTHMAADYIRRSVMSLGALASKFSVSKSLVCNIKKGRCWS